MSTLANESTSESTNELADDWIPRHRLTVDEYYRMAEVGLLAPDAQVELIQGEIIDMVPIGSRHASIVGLLNRELVFAVGTRGFVYTQSSIRLDRYSEPQPDLSLMKPRADFYDNVLPAPTDILLLIEVSVSTLRYDRQVKIPLYARHRIPEVWLIDVHGNQLERLRQPADGAYRESEVFTGGEIELPLQPPTSIDLTPLLKRRD